MARVGYIQVPFRLTKDHAIRLDKAAKHCGQTRQEFLRTTVLAELAEIEDRMRNKQAYTTMRGSVRLASTPTEEDTKNPDDPIGSGIAETLRTKREGDQPYYPRPSEMQQQGGQVVVQVGNTNAGNTGAMDQLVTFVVAGDEMGRSHRRRTAINVLHASAGSEEERKTLVARLDEAIAAKQRMPSVFSGEGGVVGKVARVAFDKLAGILK
jgi:predicted DNA-binding protein